MKIVLRTLAALAAIGAVAGAAVVFLGLYNVSARLGHLPGVSWVLHTTYRNSVETWSLGTKVPDNLGSRDMVDLGAGHFDTACRTCHAAPGERRTATTLAMLPQPPHITAAVAGWDAGELHWIVHQGIKMSGMPGWPSNRPEEVWPVVAFLALVDTMSEGDYRAFLDVAVPDDAPPGTAYCASCHEAGGVSGNAHIPRLDILSEEFMIASLLSYREGHRDSAIMSQAATEMSEAELAGLARWFAMQPIGAASDTEMTAAQIARGRDIAFADDEKSGEVPACRACHGPWPEPLDSGFPSLAGQYAPYLATQLELWRDGARGGGRLSDLMHLSAERLTDAQIDDVAAYYATLAPASLDDTSE